MAHDKKKSASKENNKEQTRSPKNRHRARKRSFSRSSFSGKKGTINRRRTREQKVHTIELVSDEKLATFALEGVHESVSFETIYEEKKQEANLQENEELHYVGNGQFAVFQVKRTGTVIEEFVELRRLTPLERPSEREAWQKELLRPVFPEHTMVAEPLSKLYQGKKIDRYLN